MLQQSSANRVRNCQLAAVVAAATILPGIAAAEQSRRAPTDLAQARPAVVITQTAWLGLFNAVFAQTRLRLHNYTRRRKWWQRNASWIQLPDWANAPRTTFDLPQYAWSRMRYFVNDMNARSIALSLGPAGVRRRIVLTIVFENAGTEIVGRCLTKLSKIYLCPLGDDRSAPDMRWNNARAQISFVPTAWRGELGYRDLRVRLTGRVSTAVCTVRGFDYCRKLANYPGRIRAAVARVIRRVMSRRQVRQGFATIMRQQLLRTRNVGRVTNVYVSDAGALVISHR